MNSTVSFQEESGKVLEIWSDSRLTTPTDEVVNGEGIPCTENCEERSGHEGLYIRELMDVIVTS